MTIEQRAYTATATLDETALREFTAHLQGTVIRPSDAGYDAARRVFNAMIDKYPALLVRCADVADVIRAVTFAREQDPPPPYGIGLQQVHGAASRVDPAATAFPHRGRWYDILILAQWADPAASDGNVQRTRALFAAMQPFLERGVYVNNLGMEEDERVRAAYGANYERLVAVKNAYDPTNLFHLNQNIKPTTS